MTVKSKVRLSERRRRKSYVSFALIGALVLCTIGGVAYATRLPAVTVSEVSVSGVLRGDEALIKEAVDKELDGTYALLVPKRLAYVLPRGSLNATLIKAFPEVAGVAVERTSNTAATVHITERTAAALYCSTTCYVMDAYGYIFDKAENEGGLRTYHGELESPLGQTYLDGGLHDFAGLVDLLESGTGRTIDEVTIDSVDDVYLHFADGGEVRFAHKADQDVLVRDTTALFDSPAFQAGRELNYVDLRFPGKAVAKFRD